jgi:hypothetical protein
VTMRALERHSAISASASIGRRTRPS